jgi:hypothetical protein
VFTDSCVFGFNFERETLINPPLSDALGHGPAVTSATSGRADAACAIGEFAGKRSWWAQKAEPKLAGSRSRHLGIAESGPDRRYRSGNIES